MNQRKLKIREALTIHHNAVAKDYDAVMTVLIGSQNYGLDTEKSDFDTFTFVLPTLRDIATLRDPVSTTREDEYGHINIKDIRLALNLLKKTSPNSVECFASTNRIIDAGYYDSIMQLLSNPYNLRCDTRHMMMAIGGMAHQLSKRNMTPGKRLSHLLRMHCMVHNYFRIDSDILSLFEDEQQLALRAKLDPENPRWEKLIAEYAAIVEEEVKSADVHYFDAHAQQAKETICDVQKKLIARKIDDLELKTIWKKEMRYMLQLTLDMEMPQECHECQFQLKFKNGEADSWYSRRCVIEQRIIEYPKPQWCPLRDARIVEKSENENIKEVLEEIKNGKV